MAQKFKTVSELQGHLKHSIIGAIEDKLTQICIKIAQANIQKLVYDVYVPQGEYAYDRTFDLLNSVTVGNINVGTKYVTFEIFMDTEKITPQLRNSFDSNQWNAHADVDSIDVSEYIPLWVEEGTEGSLWDRDGAHYMAQTHYQLDGGILAQELENALRREGWEIVRI